MDRRTLLGLLPFAVAGGGRPAAGRSAGGRATQSPTLAGVERGGERSTAALDGSATTAAAPGLDTLGVQLYTLREPLAENLEGTLAAVAEIGYGEVELFQLHGLTPREMRAELDTVGLRAASSHYGLDAIRGDVDRLVEGALELGQSLMVVASIPAEERSAEGLRRVAADFDVAANTVREAGLRFGYHNHDWEFRSLPDGTVPMELLLDRTDVELVDWQMDVFWAVNGGGDPISLLRERGGRVTSVHVKDRTPAGEMVDVGDGVIDFAEILAEAERQGLLHAFVEHDRPGDAVQSIRRSFRHLDAIGAIGGGPAAEVTSGGGL